nr:GGDEF domain-containing protein [uncultured Devosia sp.]
MAQVDVFSFTAAVTALLLAGGLLTAYAVNRSLTAFGWWALTFVLLAIWLTTSTLRLGAPAAWIKWVAWGSLYAAASLVAWRLYREGDSRANPLGRILVGTALLLAVCIGLTAIEAPPHYWLMLGPVPVLVFMTWSAVLVFRADARAYGLAIIAGIAAIAIRSIFHPAGLARFLNPPPPGALRGGFEPGSNPGQGIPLDRRPPINGVIDFGPPPGPHPPVESVLTVTFITVAALLALAAILVLRNVLTELSRMRERSTTDAMTGLLNRVTFEEAATLRLNESAARPVCLILFDIDHFKRINDTAGHAAGDQVIARLGRLLREMSLTHGIAGRIGGEEFAVILAGGDLPAAQIYAEAIRSGLSAADFGDAVGWGVTMSAGIALHQSGESLHGLTARADKALYAAKANGRDRVVVADDLSGPAPGQVRHTGLRATA